MINLSEVIETNKMVSEQTLDVRTITIGISLLDCADASLERTCANVYDKLTRVARDLVKTGDEIGRGADRQQAHLDDAGGDRRRVVLPPAR